MKIIYKSSEMIQSNSLCTSHGLCCICNSRNNRTFRLPSVSRNEEKLKRYAEWVNFAAIEHVYDKIKYYCLCEIHFEDNAFCNHLRIKLHRWAVPTVNPPIYAGPSPEDGTPTGPVELKPDIFRKIVHELMAKQERLGAVDNRRTRFLNTFGQIDLDKKSEEKENSLGTDCMNNYQSKDLGGSEPNTSYLNLSCQNQNADSFLIISDDEDPLGNIPESSNSDLLFHGRNASRSHTNEANVKYIHLPVKPKKLLSTGVPPAIQNIKSPSYIVEQDNSAVKHINVNNIGTMNVSSSNCGICPTIPRRSRSSELQSTNVRCSADLESSVKMLNTSDTGSTIAGGEFVAENIQPNNMVYKIPATKIDSLCYNGKPISVKHSVSKTNSKSSLFKLSPAVSVSPSKISMSLKTQPRNELMVKSVEPASFIASKLSTSVVENSGSPVATDVIIKHSKSPVTDDLTPSTKNGFTRTGTMSSVMDSSSSKNKKDNKRSDILLAAINSSDISISDDNCAGIEIVSCNINQPERKQDGSIKHVEKQPVYKKKKYYDPILIDSVLDKMKLKKNGPVRIVTLEKKPDRLFKGFVKNKVVTLYKQKIKKNKKKIPGTGIGARNKSTEKVRKKRKCTCSIHCQQRINGSKNSPPIINVSSGVGVKFSGNAVSSHIMNIDQELADEDLFNVENVFNVSTILTNVHDRSQIEQLCQMLLECIFRLKNLNIEGTMAKLQVYISQLPSSTPDGSISNEEAPIYPGEDNGANIANNLDKDVSVPNIEIGASGNQMYIVSSSSGQNDCMPFPSDTSSGIEIPSGNKLTNAPPNPEVPCESLDPISNLNNNHQPKSRNVKVKLSTFHDHSYIKQESNYIFEKPEYLVKLINIGTYRHPKKKIKPSQPAVSKREVEKHKKTCQKLSNKITRLRELISKKNKNIKSMHRKIKYLGGVVCQEKGIKRVKYPKDKENIDDKQVSIDLVNNIFNSEGQIAPKKRITSKKKKNPGDQFRIDDITMVVNTDGTDFINEISHCSMKKDFKKNSKKNTSLESIDVLYQNLIEEICSTELEY